MVIQNLCDLSVSDGQLSVTPQNGEEIILPVEQLQSVILETTRCNITAAVLQCLAESGVPLLVCDKKHTPVAELVSYDATANHTGLAMDQAALLPEAKAAVWERIAKQKINCQAQALLLAGCECPEELHKLEQDLVGDDFACKEGQAARIYFHRMFGYDFRRDREDHLNAGLNYGYAVLLSYINRIVRSHGYLTELGIHHCSRKNPFNLSCDIMEPFRPVIDLVVKHLPDGEWNNACKKELLESLDHPIYYKDRRWKVQDAIEQYFLDVMAAVMGNSREIGELKLVG